MGLDIIYYSEITEAEVVGETELSWDDIQKLCDAGFNICKPYKDAFGYAEDISNYVVIGECYGFRAGSYGFYGEWRNTLCQIVHGISANTFWKELDIHDGKAFYELIYFSDCEGTIGTKVSAKLAEDFKNYSRLVQEKIKGCPAINKDLFLENYNLFLEAFSVAANNGFVMFN